MKFEWDPDKEKKNRRKHGISFMLAASVFGDDYRIEKYDEENSIKHNEERYITIGKVGSKLYVISVAYTMRGTAEEGIIRLISARPADSEEEEEYWNGYSTI